MDSSIKSAVKAVRDCDAILIGAGAGMGVDSGLPDFRGNEGFWRAYPPFKKLGLSFYDLADPRWFRDKPHQAWGFYGHRFHLYQSTTPHEGFQTLRRWASEKSGGAFVFTSNVDCHFQQSGFDAQQIVECHGSFSHLQCSGPCSNETWPASRLNIKIDESTMLAHDPLPNCPTCESVARPNILMFSDWNWIDHRTTEQFNRYTEWLRSIPVGRLCIVEIGAGTAVPTVRSHCQQLMTREQATLIRINPRESHGPPGTISIPGNGLQTLTEMEQRM